MLLAPSWGGMINGLLTLRGAWDKVREDAVLKFMVVAVTAYGMATFEGPMLSLKNVNAIMHYTDWIIAHVHVGALGWNGFLTFGILYWLVPRMWNTTLYSRETGECPFLDRHAGYRVLRGHHVHCRTHAVAPLETVHGHRDAAVSEFPGDGPADLSAVHHPCRRRNAVPDRRRV